MPEETLWVTVERKAWLQLVISVLMKMAQFHLVTPAIALAICNFVMPYGLKTGVTDGKSQ